MPDHKHRFQVEPPCGKAELTGVCRCGDVRLFPAVMPEGGWQKTGRTGKPVISGNKKGTEQ